jgi:hypothetical protein
MICEKRPGCPTISKRVYFITTAIIIALLFAGTVWNKKRIARNKIEAYEADFQRQMIELQNVAIAERDIRHAERDAIRAQKIARGEIVEKIENVIRNDYHDGGAVLQVVYWLKLNMNEATPIEYIEWSKVVIISDDYAFVRCKFRIKNMFNAYVIHNKVFTLNRSGRVVGVEDYKP